MSETKAVLTCSDCGKRYDPNSDRWRTVEDETGVSYFAHNCDKFTVVINFPDDSEYKEFADTVKDAILRTME
jgi:hypothetical protein